MFAMCDQATMCGICSNVLEHAAWHVSHALVLNVRHQYLVKLSLNVLITRVDSCTDMMQPIMRCYLPFFILRVCIFFAPRRDISDDVDCGLKGPFGQALH